MAENIEVEVLRELNGGEFQPGDTRELSKADAERLAATGAVRIKGSKAKAEPPVENKAEGASPANKSDAPRRTKKVRK